MYNFSLTAYHSFMVGYYVKPNHNDVMTFAKLEPQDRFEPAIILSGGSHLTRYITEALSLPFSQVFFFTLAVPSAITRQPQIVLSRSFR